MVSTEEQELIDLRIKWADMPILNFWHNTNDAPDTFFDELLDASRGDETSETKAKRTTTRSKGSGDEETATSSYRGAVSKGAKIVKKPTKKGWGKFWKYVDSKGKTKLSEGRAGQFPNPIDRKSGLDCENMVVTKGLDLQIGYGRGTKGTTAFEKGPVRGTSEYMKIDRKCNNCGNGWPINADFKDAPSSIKCPKCKKSNDFKDIKGPYKESGEVLVIPVGMVGDGQTVAFMLLTKAEAKKMSFLKPGDRVCIRGWVKGQGYDASVINGLGFSSSGLKHYGYKFGKTSQAVPLITLGDRGYDGYIKKV